MWVRRGVLFVGKAGMVAPSCRQRAWQGQGLQVGVQWSEVLEEARVPGSGRKVQQVWDSSP
jgi:hypothetical protein